MRQDDLARFRRRTPEHDRQRSVQAPAAARVWPAVLVLLVVATSLALAFYASAWLVVPYLAVISLVLRPPGTGRRVGNPSTAKISESLAPAERIDEVAGTVDVDSVVRTESLLTVVVSNAPGEAEADRVDVPNPELLTGKTRRGKGRGRKPKSVAATAFELSEPVWVRVGPGKFVRADLATSTTAEEVASPADAETETQTVVDQRPLPDSNEASVDESVTPMEAVQALRGVEPGAEGTLAKGSGFGLIDSDQAARPSGEGDEEGSGWDRGVESDLGQKVSAGGEPDFADVGSSGDNGIAPDAFEENAAEVPSVDSGLSPIEFEVEPLQNQAQTPEIVSDVPTLGPTEVVVENPEPNPEQTSFPAVVFKIARAWREPLSTRSKTMARPQRQRSLVVQPRGSGARSSLKKAGATRRASGPSGQQWGVGRSNRVAGAIRQPYLPRHASRPFHPDRTHPPRSPPCRGGTEAERLRGAVPGRADRSRAAPRCILGRSRSDNTVRSTSPKNLENFETNSSDQPLIFKLPSYCDGEYGREP